MDITIYRVVTIGWKLLIIWPVSELYDNVCEGYRSSWSYLGLTNYKIISKLNMTTY